MGTQTNIEWCDHTFNAWRGCEKVAGHPACDHCYAEALSKRNPAVLGTWGGASTGGVRVVAAPDYWKLPMKWDRMAAAAGKRATVFALSQGDVCEEWPGRVRSAEKDGGVLWYRPGGGVIRAGQTTVNNVCGERLATLDDVRGQLVKTIDATQNLIWLLLTKRPERIASCFGSQPRPNVMWGTSVSDQATANAFATPLIRSQQTWGRTFLSIEPLLGPVDLTRLDNGGGETYNALDATVTMPDGHTFKTSDTSPLAWVIVGAESGPKARPCHPQWVRAIRDQCAKHCVPFFFKQWGEWLPISQMNSVQHRYFRRFVKRRTTYWFERTPVFESANTFWIGKYKSGKRLDRRAHLDCPTWFDAPIAGGREVCHA